MSMLFEFIRLGRPLHLLGGLLFLALGSLIAVREGAAFQFSSLLWAMLSVAAIQLMTHYSNDYFDLDTDRANPQRTRWSGGSGVLPAGNIAPRVALSAAYAWIIVALVVAIPLTLGSPAPALTLGLLALALVLSWGYSAPPLWLNRRSLGELTGALVIAGLPIFLGYQLQTGSIGRTPLLAALPLMCMQFAMLIAANFPDAASDAAVGKQTLVVRLGVARSAWLYCAALALAYLCLPLIVGGGFPLAVAGSLLLGAPLAGWLALQAWRGTWLQLAVAEQVGFWSIGLLIGSALLMSFSFYIQ